MFILPLNFLLCGRDAFLEQLLIKLHTFFQTDAAFCFCGSRRSDLRHFQFLGTDFLAQALALLFSLFTPFFPTLLQLSELTLRRILQRLIHSSPGVGYIA